MNEIVAQPEPSLRYRELDMAKGIGIILVILGHMNISNTIIKIIFSFHMPLFIVISGILFKNDKKKLIKNSVTYLGSYFFMGIFTTIAYSLISCDSQVLTHLPLRLLLGGCAPNYKITPDSALWFLIALMAIEWFTYAIYRTKIRPIVWCFAFVLCGVCFSLIKEQGYVLWNLDVATILLPFFVFGYELRVNLFSASKIKTIYLLVIAIISSGVTIALCHFNGSVNVYRLLYGKSIILFYLNGMSGTIAIFCIVAILHRISFFKIVQILLSYIGEHTLAIMGIHQLLLEICEDYFTSISNYSRIIRYGIYLVEILFVLSVSVVLSNFFFKLVPKILGRRKVND